MKIGILAGVDLSIAVYLLMLFTLTQADNDEICETESCNRTANNDLRFMNKIVDPCNDFYNYTCGFPVDNDDDYGGNFDSGVKDQINRIKNAVRKIPPVGNATILNSIFKTYFISCMEPVTRRSHQSFSDFLLRLDFKLKLEAGRWSQPTEFNWIKTTKTIANEGLINGLQTFLFSFNIKRDPTVYFKSLITLGNSIQSGVANHRNIRRQRFRAEYSYTQKFLEHANIPINSTDIDKVQADVFQEVFDFEEKLILIFNYKDEYKDKELITVKNLSMIAPKIPWLSFIQSVVDTLSFGIVNETEIIAIESVKVMQELENLISNIPSNVLLTYIAYATHMTYLRDVDNGIKRDFKYCLENNLSSYLMPMLLEKKLMGSKEKTKKEYILQLSEKIREAFIEIINDEWHWMDKSTKVQAIEKLKSMPVVVVFKETWHLVHQLYYARLKLNSPYFYWTVLRLLRKVDLEMEFKLLYFPLIFPQTLPFMSYKPIHLIGNIIYIPLYGLRNYEIDNDRPDYLNFIKVGWDIAQMMASPFIGQQQPFSSKRILPWLIKPRTQMQNAVVSFLVDQYSNFPGTKTDDVMGKILSRYLGFQIVRRLFKNWANATEAPQWRLPNHNNTLDQMFFIMAGSKYCRHEIDDSLLPQDTLQGIVQNSQEFRDAFSCTVRAEMNPKEKCRSTTEETCYNETVVPTDLRFMNRIADPCDDFYNYTCGFPLDNDENYGRDFDVDVEIQINRIQNAITRIDGSNALTEYRNLKIYFDSCMKPEKNQNLPIFYNFLLQLGFKLQLEAGEWKQTGEFNWITTTQNVTRRGLINGFQTFLFSVKMKPSPIDSSKPIIVLRNSIQSRVANHRNIRKLHFDNDYAYIQKFLNNSNIQSEGIDIDKVRVDIFQKVFDFEEKLIEVVNFRDEEKADELMTIKNLSMIAPKIPWLNFIRSIVSTLSKKIVKETEIIAVESVEVMQKLENLISNTSQNVLLTYIAYTTHMTYLRDVETERDFEFCLENNPLSNIMPMLLSQKVMTPEEKSKREYIFQLTEKIKQVFLKIINDEWHWMGKSTKVQAIDKLKAMSIAVVYVDIPVFDYYFGFELKSSDVYWSVLRQIKTLQLQRQIETLPISRAVSRPVPSMSYEPIHLIDNMIYISLFGLRNYKIDNDRPDYLNFIKVGWDIAQMMSSAFIGQHRPSPSERILPWMSEPTKQKQNAIISCFVDQYSKFPGSETDIKYNNRNLMGQILSRNLGFQIVHRVFSNWANAPQTPQWRLPNHNNTRDQMFFIVAGSQYCRQEIDDSLFPQYALQGIVKNSREFGDAFSCTAGTKMNPEQKCRFSTDEEICYTKSCNETTLTDLRFMNKIADPCDDFFNYTCGSPRVDDTHYGSDFGFNKTELNFRDIQNAINTIDPHESCEFGLDEVLCFLKTCFTSCMKNDYRSDRILLYWIISTIRFNIKLEAGRIIQTGEFKWIEPGRSLPSLRFQYFVFDVRLNPPTINSPERLIFLRNAIPSRWDNRRNDRKKFFANDNLYTEKFIHDIEPVIGNLSTNFSIENFRTDVLQKSFDFEEKLIEMVNLRDEGKSEEVITIQNLSMIAPGIPWLDIIQAIDTWYNIPPFLNLTKQKSIAVESVKMMQEMAKLISNTPKDVLLTYIAYNSHMAYLRDVDNEIERDFVYCLENNPFSDLMPMLLATKVMTPEDKSNKEYILQLSEKIKQTFLEIINNEWHWMSTSAKLQTFEKIKSISVEVVHKDPELEMKEIELYYKNFHLLGGFGYWIVLKSIERWRLLHQMKILPESQNTSRRLPHMSHQSIQLLDNVIYISLFNLRNYNIINDGPGYLNFIRVGWDIAQMMASAVIDQLSLSESVEQNATFSCFSEKYKKLSGDAGMHPDEVKTIISREIGLRIIYRVFENWVDITEPSQWKLPNHNNTLDQMFFIIAQSQHCHRNIYDIISAHHIHLFQGMMQSFPEFNKAFSCMNDEGGNYSQQCRA